MHDFIQHCAHSEPESPPFFNLNDRKFHIWHILFKCPVKRLSSNISTYLAYKYVRINRGTLNNVIRMDPLAAEPRWYLSSLHMAVRTGESVGLRKYQNATAPANANCWQAERANRIFLVRLFPTRVWLIVVDISSPTEYKFACPNQTD